MPKVAKDSKVYQCCWYDMTRFLVKSPLSVEALHVILARLKCKDYRFSEEKGAVNGTLHYQIRIQLGMKITLGGLIKALEGQGMSNIACTCADNRNFIYIEKAETHVSGPYGPVEAVEPEIKIPWPACKYVDSLRPFQEKVLADLQGEKQEGIINCLVDFKGQLGKSIIKMIARCKKIAGIVPNVGDAHQIIAAVQNMPTRTAYILDLPKSTNPKHAAMLYACIEQIKDGAVVEIRNAWAEKIMDSPIIWVFTNSMPYLKLLTAVRWRLWSISENFDLIPLTPPEVPLAAAPVPIGGVPPTIPLIPLGSHVLAAKFGTSKNDKIATMLKENNPIIWKKFKKILVAKS